MEEPARFDVFISYSEADKDWVTAELVPRLERAALRVCLDRRDFEFGAPIVENIAKGVKTSRFTLLVLTQAWVGDGVAQLAAQLAETSDAAVQRHKIISLRLQRTLLLTPDWLAGLTEFDFTEGDVAEKWERLLRLLHREGDSATVVPQITPALVEHQRQLDPLARWVLEVSPRVRAWLGLLSVVPLILVAVLGGLLALGQEHPSWGLFVFALLPLVLQSGALVLGGRAVDRARALQRACRPCALALVLTWIGGPFIALIAAFIAVLTLDTIETSVHPALRYAVVASRAGRCTALLTTYSDHVRISYGGDDGIPSEDRRNTDGLAIETALASLGRRVVVPGGQRLGRVRRVYGTGLGSNAAEIAIDGGGVTRHGIEGLCLP